MSQTIDITTATAAQVATALATAEAEQDNLHRQSVELAQQRIAALLGEDDSVVDRIEADIALVMRGLDRAEVRIPELRRLHSEALERETTDRDLGEFNDAVAARISAAREIDHFLAKAGEAFRAYATAGHRLQVIHPFHRATIGSQEDSRALNAAARFSAAELFSRLDRNESLFNPPEPLRDAEESRWNRVRASLKLPEREQETA